MLMLSYKLLRRQQLVAVFFIQHVQCPYLGHRHLLHRVHHVRGLFTPVAFDYVALY